MRRKPQYIFCASVRLLASLRHIYLGSFFLDPEDIKVLGVGVIWNFVKGTITWYRIGGTKGLS